MKFLDISKATNTGKMNIIALLFVLIAIAGVFLTLDPGKAERDKKEKVEKLKEIAADTSIKNITVEYKESDPGEFQQVSNLSKISGYTGKFFQSMLTVVVLLMIFAIVMYLLKKKQKLNFGSTNNIKIIDRKYLGQKQYLVTVIVDDEKLLLGVTDQSINMIKKLSYDSKFEQQKEAVTEKETTETFPKILGKIRNKKNEN